jgi:3-hydroxyisobutyrate dehydrogenase
VAERVAWLCLGVMGAPMAGHLASAGHGVTVWNRTAAKAEAWALQHRGAVATTPREAVHGASFVFLCSGDDGDVRTLADAALPGLARGAIFVDHTTVSAEVTLDLAARAEEQGVAWLDAPVSGGQAGAENGKLTVMVGGEEAAFERAHPLMQTYGRTVTHMGPSGSGQLTKMVNQICIAGLVQALSEGLRFAQRAGLDAARVVEVISKGAAQSWQMDNRATTMLAGEFDFGFAVDWMRKDLRIALEEARRNGAQLPVAELVDRFYAAVQEHGGRRWDTSSLITLLD